MFKFYTGIFITSSNCCTGRCFPFFHFKSFFFHSSMNLLAAICCIGGGLHNEHRPIVAQVLCIMPSPQRSFLQSWVSHINLFDYPHVTTLLNVHPTTDCWCVRVALFYCTFFNTFSILKESFHITLEGGGVFFPLSTSNSAAFAFFSTGEAFCLLLEPAPLSLHLPPTIFFFGLFHSLDNQ